MQEDPSDATQQPLNSWLSALPLRAAPSSLEARVLEELRRRAALPWWRGGFARWPLLARTAFLATCGALVGWSLFDHSWTIPEARIVHFAAGLSTSWTHPAVAAVSSVADLAALVVAAIPAVLIYCGIAAGVLLYAALFGLGAAAYRAIYRQPTKTGYPS